MQLQDLFRYGTYLLYVISSQKEVCPSPFATIVLNSFSVSVKYYSYASGSGIFEDNLGSELANYQTSPTMILASAIFTPTTTTHHAPACPKTQRTKKTACKARNKKLLSASLFFIGFNPMPMPMAISHSPPPHLRLYLRNGARRCTAHGLEVFTVSACSPLPSRGLRVCAPSSPPGPTLLVLHRSIIDH